MKRELLQHFNSLLCLVAGTGSGLSVAFSLGCQLVAIVTVCALLICIARRRNV